MPFNQPNLKDKDMEKAPEALRRQLEPSAKEFLPRSETERAPEASDALKTAKAEHAMSSKPVLQSAVPAIRPPEPKSELLLEVEDILASDLGDAYSKMPPETQRKFKAKGEEIARTVWQMLETAKLQLKKILSLIREWLKMIPAVNRYFLEQETKIKIDKIINLAHKQK